MVVLSNLLRVTLKSAQVICPVSLFLICMLIFSSPAFSQKRKVPDIVKETFEKQYPEAQKPKWEWKKKLNLYEVEFDLNDSEYEAYYSIDGKWVWTERDIKISDVPKGVMESLAQTEYATWEIDDVEEHQSPDQPVIYEFELEYEDDDGKQEKYLYFLPDGELWLVLEDEFEYFQSEDLYIQQDTSLLMASIPLAFTQVPYFTYGQGLGIISADSLFSMNIRFRIQNRAGLNMYENQESLIDARVRRLRLRFDGFVYDPRISYVLQLSFTREDMDWDNTQFPNIIRDAMIFYQVNDNLIVGVGQTKLPGNRQRLISSGDLQFVDRSIVNATLNVDRDFGIQARYSNRLFGEFHYVLNGAVSTGEGRNVLATDSDLSYTGRVELLPLGKFTRFGDYFEGDLIRERSPKISVGLTLNQNFNTVRTGGQLGSFLYQPRDISTYMSDWLMKYNGFSFSSEFLYRTSPDPITMNGEGDIRYVYTGFGQNYQASYVFLNNFEVAGRLSSIAPGTKIRNFDPAIKHFTVGLSKYLKGHRVKIQTDLTREEIINTESPDISNWILRFQIELGI